MPLIFDSPWIFLLMLVGIGIFVFGIYIIMKRRQSRFNHPLVIALVIVTAFVGGCCSVHVFTFILQAKIATPYIQQALNAKFGHNVVVADERGFGNDEGELTWQSADRRIYCYDIDEGWICNSR